MKHRQTSLLETKRITHSKIQRQRSDMELKETGEKQEAVDTTKQSNSKDNFQSATTWYMVKQLRMCGQF